MLRFFIPYGHYVKQEGAICTLTGIPYPYGHFVTVGII